MFLSCYRYDKELGSKIVRDKSPLEKRHHRQGPENMYVQLKSKLITEVNKGIEKMPFILKEEYEAHIKETSASIITVQNHLHKFCTFLSDKKILCNVN